MKVANPHELRLPSPQRRFDYGATLGLLTHFQGMGAQRLLFRPSIDRQDLLEHIRQDATGHKNRKMGLEFIQFRRRPAIHWPSNAGLRGATCFASKLGKTQRHPPEERCDWLIPIVLHPAFSAASPAIRPSHGMASGGSGDDFPQIIGPCDLHDIRALRLPLALRFNQPQNPTHRAPAAK
jgi:hypothetical protein